MAFIDYCAVGLGKTAPLTTCNEEVFVGHGVQSGKVRCLQALRGETVLTHHRRRNPQRSTRMSCV